jgi:hypothetical protein
MRDVIEFINVSIAVMCWGGYATMCYSVCLGVDMIVDLFRR